MARDKVTAKRFFDLVVLVLGEKTTFRANTAVPMAEVRDEVLRRADLTDEERELGETKLRRKVEFAFRNRRAKYCGTHPERALTRQVGKGGQWGLTELGAERAKELAQPPADDPAPEDPSDDPAPAPEADDPTESPADA